MTHSSNGRNLVKVVDVHMHKHPVETSKNLLAGGKECLREGSAWRSGQWEEKDNYTILT